jgi:hypothetical protein
VDYGSRGHSHVAKYKIIQEDFLKYISLQPFLLMHGWGANVFELDLFPGLEALEFFLKIDSCREAIANLLPSSTNPATANGRVYSIRRMVQYSSMFKKL